MSQLNRQALLAIGSLLIIVVGLVLIVSANGGNTAPSAISTRVTAPAPVGEDPYLEIPRVRLADAKAAYDQKQAVFVDVRSADSYQAGHIPGALSIPLDDLEGRLKELKLTDWIITYCTWPSEESSARAARILLDNGFTKVTPILGGFRAWANAGYPVEP